jgi:periodic tryptophan protein 2
MSPTGRAWCAATTEGLLIYSLDERMIFDPLDLDVDITPDNILKTLKKKEYLKALVVSFLSFFSQRQHNIDVTFLR